MKRLSAIAGLLAASVLLAAAKDYRLHSFQKIQITDQFWGEGANLGDFNRDGKMDVASGPFWYEGPDYKKRHEILPAPQTFQRKKADGTTETIPGYEGALGTNNAYSHCFLVFCDDFNGDAWTDIYIVGLPGEKSYWYENPRNQPGHWKAHLAVEVPDNESPNWGDLTGDGKPELVFHSGGVLGYSTPDWNNPQAVWTFHPLSPKGAWHKYSHGVGFGDLNSDGRADFLEKDAWWEQPASLVGNPLWTRHEQNFGPGGAQMLVYDVNGDGLNDVITALEAHGHGLAWFEQVFAGGKRTFRQHDFMGKIPADSKYGVAFSQPHALALVDMDGDGLQDFVVGKRFWAHGPNMDPTPNDPAVLYWFQLVRGKNKTVEYVPHLVDNNSGVGTQVVAADLNGDKLPDIIVGNKRGVFVFLHQARKVSKKEWLAAQPQPTSPTK